jgi:maltose O-acetyltransferase
MRDRMRAGLPYRADDPQLRADYLAAQRLLARFNASAPGDDRQSLLEELLGSCGPGVTITAPLRLDYGQYIHIGAGSFLNYDCVLLDVCEIAIGQRCQLGPRVQILTATHPLDPAERAVGWESGAPVHIADDVWIGGGAIILPGVSVGTGSVVGAGSVVTRDVSPGMVVAGNPARELRRVPDHPL